MTDKDKPTLFYVGDGRFLVGVPTSDLTAQDLALRGLSEKDLIASGLYAKKPAKDEETPE